MGQVKGLTIEDHLSKYMFILGLTGRTGNWSLLIADCSFDWSFVTPDTTRLRDCVKTKEVAHLHDQRDPTHGRDCVKTKEVAHLHDQRDPTHGSV